MASGITTSTDQSRRPGMFVRSMANAAAVPITAQPIVTTTVSRTVFQSSVRGEVAGMAAERRSFVAFPLWARPQRDEEGQGEERQ